MNLVEIKDFLLLQTISKPLARRLSFALLALGIAATVVTTAVQTFRDFQAEIGLLETRLENVKDAYGPSLAASVWRFSDIQVELELQGLLNTPGFEYAEINTVEGQVWAVGVQNSSSTVVKEIPLIYSANGMVHELGRLTVVAGTQEIYDRLKVHALELLLYFGAWTFVLAGSMFWIFRRLVTRHLDTLANYTSSISLDIQAPPLVLDRVPSQPGAEDELDQVANSINSLRTQLANSILELERNQEFLRKALDDSEKASNAKSDFLASMSHELRTPLNAVLGFAQMLQLDQDSPLTPTQKDHVDIILEGGSHLLELINSILDLSKIEADQLSPDLEDINPCDVVAECVSLTMPLGKPRNITINDRCSGKHLPQIRSDRTRLKQILLNLLSNALKYNEDDGTIILDGQETDNGFLRISVTDTGIGISQKDQAHIFQMFYRLGADPMKAREGMGIGLTVTKLLVEKLGGRIGLESEKDVGSTFWIELPLTTNEDVFIWNDRLRVGIDAIDKDHQVILRLVNDLTSRYTDDEDVDKVIKELMDYTRFHFRREEAVMEATGYAYIETHRGIHADLISHASDLVDKWHRERNPEMLRRFRDFLKHELMDHMMREDFKLDRSMK